MGAWDCRGKTVHWTAALAQYYLTDCVEQAEPKHRHQDIARLCRQFSCGKDACRQVWSQTSETARHQGLLCDYFVAYIRVSSFPPAPPWRSRRIFRHGGEWKGRSVQSVELISLQRQPCDMILTSTISHPLDVTPPPASTSVFRQLPSLPPT